MKLWLATILGTLLFLGGSLLAPEKCWSETSYSGRLSTVLEWYDDEKGDLALPIYQYGLLNFRNLTDQGLKFKMYGRLAKDINDRIDRDSQLYYFYLEQKNIANHLDIKLGRQFITSAAGASHMDGLSLKIRDLGPISVKLFGGGDVKFEDEYDEDDIIGGISVSGKFFERFYLSAGYIQKWDEQALTKELIGFDAEYEIRHLLKIYNDTQYNILNESFSYVLAGAKYYPDENWNIKMEYLYSLPVFESTSIYSVFAVEEYEELMGEFSYKFKPGLRGFIQYRHEFYDEFTDANVVEIGFEQSRVKRFYGYVIGTYRNDPDADSLRGIKVYGSYLFHRYCQTGVGMNVDVLERSLDDDDDTTSNRVWIDVTSYINKTFNLSVKIERSESVLYDEYFSGRVKFDVNF